MFTRSLSLLLVLLAALALAGCGDDDSSSSDSGSDDTAAETADDSGSDAGDDGSADAGAGETLDLGVDGNNLAFDKTELTAKAGTVTLKLTNTSSIQHNVAIEDEDGEMLGEEGELVGADGVSEVTVDLEPGTYTYYCSPHKSSGMTGTLTVT